MSEHDNTVCDAKTQTLRCTVCGDEVPIPLGTLSWVLAVMEAFSKEHSSSKHEGRRTWFSGNVKMGAGRKPRRRIVCICGSTRFRNEMNEVNCTLTLAGKIVLAPGVFGHDGDAVTDAEKILLDELHRAKIDLADEICVINPGGTSGKAQRRKSSTRSAPERRSPIHTTTTLTFPK
jgi:hypothetical protein